MLQTDQASHFFRTYRALQPRPSKLARKTDLTAERFRRVVGHVFIVERVDDRFQFRLFGTRIVDITGHDHNGQFLDEVLSGSDLDHVDTLFSRCLDERIAIASTERLLYTGKEYLEVEILRTPWTDDEGEPRYISGTFAKLLLPGKGVGPKVRSQEEFDFVHDAAPRVEIPLTVPA